MNKDITVLILTHKSKDLVLNYIKNIYKKFKIIVVDNSNDVELEKYLKENYPETTIKLIENNGYGNAINFGSKLVETKYFLASNPDLKGIDENSLLKFLSAANILKDKFSTMGPRYKNADPKSLIQSDESKEISEIKVISGACMFFNKENFDLLGGFDENIFLFFEENEFCVRSFRKNKNYQINNINVIHDVGNSVTTKNTEEKELQDNLRSWHFMWSKFYFFKKRFTFLFALIYFIPVLIRLFLRIFFHTITSDKKKLKKYKVRLYGLFCSIIGKNSFYRISH